jgi:hypothetical protein
MPIATDRIRDAVEHRLLRLGFHVDPLATAEVTARFARRAPACAGLHYAVTVLGVPSALSVWTTPRDQLDQLDAARRDDRAAGRVIAVHELLLPEAVIVFELTAPPAAGAASKLTPHLRSLIDAFPDRELQRSLTDPAPGIAS